MIAMRLLRPIWGAARPTPGAAWQVSTMSAIRPADLLGTRIDVGVLRGQPRIAVPHDVADQAGGPAGKPGRRRAGMSSGVPTLSPAA